MAEAMLMEGNAPEAKREAIAALEINPHSREARLALKRARGDADVTKQTPESLLAQARDYLSRGQMRKARRRLLRALQQSSGNCMECHQALARVYEAEGQAQKALIEWQAVAAQAADAAMRQQAHARIDGLKQKTARQ
jgi:tetratricopeptide (TPR) repeat protein